MSELSRSQNPVPDQQPDPLKAALTNIGDRDALWKYVLEEGLKHEERGNRATASNTAGKKQKLTDIDRANILYFKVSEAAGGCPDGAEIIHRLFLELAHDFICGDNLRLAWYAVSHAHDHEANNGARPSNYDWKIETYCELARRLFEQSDSEYHEMARSLLNDIDPGLLDGATALGIKFDGPLIVLRAMSARVDGSVKKEFKLLTEALTLLNVEDFEYHREFLAEVRLELGRIYLTHGDSSAAIEHWKAAEAVAGPAAAKFGAKYDQILGYIIDFAFLCDDMETTERYARKRLEFLYSQSESPDPLAEAETCFYLSVCHSEKADYQVANGLCSRALSVIEAAVRTTSPDDDPILTEFQKLNGQLCLQWGDICLALENLDLAQEFYTKALSVWSTFPHAESLLGGGNLKLGQLAIRKDPKHGHAAALEYWTRAAECFESSIEKHCNDDLENQRSNGYDHNYLNLGYAYTSLAQLFEQDYSFAALPEGGTEFEYLDRAIAAFDSPCISDRSHLLHTLNHAIARAVFWDNPDQIKRYQGRLEVLKLIG